MNIDSQSQEPTGRGIVVGWITPYLLAVWCCLAVLSGNASHIPPMFDLFKLIASVLVAVGLLHAFLIFVIKREGRELILFALVSMIGLYGGIGVNFASSIGWPAFTAVWVVVHFAAIAMFYCFGSHEKVKALVPVAAIGIGLTLIFQIYGVAAPVANDVSQLPELQRELAKQDVSRELELELASETKRSPETLPDIYYIIVDAYAGQSVLKEIYEFDNAPFVESLRKRNFHVADASRSNYQSTEFSLASSLNMTHLGDLDLQRFKTRIPIRDMIANNSVAKTLAANGYKTIGFESGKIDTECKQFDEYLCVGSGLNDYEDVVYHNSLLPGLIEFSRIPIQSAARRHGERTIKTLELIPTVVSSDSKPTFVFSHLLAPHPPFVNDESGDDVSLFGHYLLADGEKFTRCFDYDQEVYRTAYRNQVAFINTKLTEMIDQIQSSNRNSIVIIQADHGPRLGFGSRPAPIVDKAELHSRYREAYSILNAIYVPEDLSPKFYSTMTPVNTFRLIFNELFEMNLELKDDESFFEKNYAFEDVTQRTLPLENFTKSGITKNN